MHFVHLIAQCGRGVIQAQAQSTLCFAIVQRQSFFFPFLFLQIIMQSYRDWPLIPSFWTPWSWRGAFDDADSDLWPDTSSSQDQPQSTSSSMAVEQPRQQQRIGGGQGLKTWTHHQAGIVKTEKKPTGELVIKAQLPGVNRDDVRLDLKEEDNESVLTLTLEKKEDHNTTDRWGGTFNRSSFFKVIRSIPLGAKVSVDEVKADLADECLVVEVKLPQHAQKEKPSSRIDIHSSRKGVGSVPQHQQQQKQSQIRAGKGEAMDTDLPAEQ
jgi:HSP20 family molecular chaperone IbpA